MSVLRKDPISDAGSEERSQATRIIERWRSRGFDTLLYHPSGYCSPANSHAMRAPLPGGYLAYPLDSEDAVAGLAASIAAGATYRAF
jgi:hypothetical protein